MKKVCGLIFIFYIQSLQAAMTKDFVVTRIDYNQEQKHYQVDFKNETEAYSASETLKDCLRELKESLKKKKPVRVIFDPQGLVISSCSKVIPR